MVDVDVEKVFWSNKYLVVVAWKSRFEYFRLRNVFG